MDSSTKTDATATTATLTTRAAERDVDAATQIEAAVWLEKATRWEADQSKQPGLAAAECVLKLEVTPEDFQCSRRDGLRNPILCALQRQTQTLWRFYDDGFMLEAMAPYRSCQLPEEAVEQWRQFQISGEMSAPIWALQLLPARTRDDYPLIEQIQTYLQARRGPQLRSKVNLSGRGQ